MNRSHNGSSFHKASVVTSYNLQLVTKEYWSRLDAVEDKTIKGTWTMTEVIYVPIMCPATLKKSKQMPQNSNKRHYHMSRLKSALKQFTAKKRVCI